MDAKSATTRPRLSHRVGALVDGFETIVYATAFLLLVAAAVLVVIGGIQEVMQAATHKVATLQGGVLVLDRVLMVLIIAEIAGHPPGRPGVPPDRRRAVSLHRVDCQRATDPGRDRRIRGATFEPGP